MLQMHEHISLKRRLSASSLTYQTRRDGWRKQARCSSELKFCRVCNDQARIVNYGALSCQSCKTFFRRNGLHPEDVHPCSNNSSCEVTKETRRYCAACRLAKCFSVGMCADLIRKEVQNGTKHSLSSKSRTGIVALCNGIKLTSRLRRFDYSHNHRSVLANCDLKILSNVPHALQTYSAVPKVREIIENDLSTFFGVPFDETDAVQSISYIYTSIRSFLESMPDFHILTSDEKCSLFDRNLNGIVTLYSAVVFRDANVTNNSQCIRSFVSIYGLEMMVELVRISKQLDVDFTVIALMLLILAFSSNCSMVGVQEEMYQDSLLTGTYRLFGSQNAYVEVLWKYMVHRYGPYRSALRFTQLIKPSLDLIKYSANAYMNNPTYHHLIDGFNQEAKQLLIANQNEEFHLWGRCDI